jgi:signal transduction histidine kinase
MSTKSNRNIQILKAAAEYFSTTAGAIVFVLSVIGVFFPISLMVTLPIAAGIGICFAILGGRNALRKAKEKELQLAEGRQRQDELKHEQDEILEIAKELKEEVKLEREELKAEQQAIQKNVAVLRFEVIEELTTQKHRSCSLVNRPLSLFGLGKKAKNDDIIDRKHQPSQDVVIAISDPLPSRRLQKL